MAGRKGLGQELKIVKRYSELTGPFFKVLKEMIKSEEKADKKWAVEQLNKAYSKMIPTTMDVNTTMTMAKLLDELDADNEETTKG